MHVHCNIKLHIKTYVHGNLQELTGCENQTMGNSIKMLIVDLAKLKETCVEDHHTCQPDMCLGVVFGCESEPSIPHTKLDAVVRLYAMSLMIWHGFLYPCCAPVSAVHGVLIHGIE